MFHNIAFSGGGTHTLAFIGCIKYLKEVNKLDEIKNLIGASAGSLIALLVILNWTYEDMYKFCTSDLIKFVDNMNFSLTSIFNLPKIYGMNDGKDIIKLVESILIKSNLDPNITFLEITKLYGRNIIIATTNLTEQKIEYLSIDTYPEMKITTAIRMSTSIPILFSPVKYYEDLYVDSLVYNNFPVDFFERFKVDTLGLNLVSSENFKKINCCADYIYLLYAGFCDSIFKKHTQDYNFICNIPIKNSLKKFDFYKMKFNLNIEMIDEIMEVGYNTLSVFIQKSE